MDVAKYIAKKLGYSEDQIIWKEAPSKQREAMIQNGDVDMILATYSITDERKKPSPSPARTSWPDRICSCARTTTPSTAPKT